MKFNRLILKFIKKYKGSKITKSPMKEIRVEKLALLTVMAYHEGAYVISGMLDRGCFTAVF